MTNKEYVIHKLSTCSEDELACDKIFANSICWLIPEYECDETDDCTKCIKEWLSSEYKQN